MTLNIAIFRPCTDAAIINSSAQIAKYRCVCMRSKRKYIFLFIFMLLVAPQAYAYESFGLSADQQKCFSYAMIGMDSVINSRLGLPAEHALEISRVNNFNSTSEKFDTVVLNVMLNAYLWKTSPHSYALKVFFECASRNSVQQQQAKIN